MIDPSDHIAACEAAKRSVPRPDGPQRDPTTRPAVLADNWWSNSCYRRTAEIKRSMHVGNNNCRKKHFFFLSFIFNERVWLSPTKEAYTHVG
jgi:hypothetical protein